MTTSNPLAATRAEGSLPSTVTAAGGESDLLVGLPQRGRDLVGVPGVDAAPGERHLAGVLAQRRRPLDEREVGAPGVGEQREHRGGPAS